MDNIRGLIKFSELVGSGEKWDHKRTLKSGRANKDQTHTFPGNPSGWFYSPEENASYSAEIFSNVHYGYITAAVGYERDVVLDAAGKAQKKEPEGDARATEFREKNPEPQNLPPAYNFMKWGDRGQDDPADQSAILLGRHLFENYGYDLSKEDFQFELRHWKNLNKLEGVQPQGATRLEAVK